MKNNNKHSTIYVTKSDHTKGAAAYIQQTTTHHGRSLPSTNKLKQL